MHHRDKCKFICLIFINEIFNPKIMYSTSSNSATGLNSFMYSTPDSYKCVELELMVNLEFYGVSRTNYWRN